jgi:hypothetical protein
MDSPDAHLNEVLPCPPGRTKGTLHLEQRVRSVHYVAAELTFRLEVCVLYKVTPMLPPEAAKSAAGSNGRTRRRRKTAIYDSEGNEVLITLICLKCRTMKPLAQFGLRKMPDGAVRNQPWCRECRSANATAKAQTPVDQPQAVTDAEAVKVSAASSAMTG